MRLADLAHWRWTPTFALVGGSLLFVLVVVAIVPDNLGGADDGAAEKQGPVSPSGSADSDPADAPPAGSAHRRTGAAGQRLSERRSRLPLQKDASEADHRVESLFQPAPPLPAPPPYEPPPAEASRPSPPAVPMLRALLPGVAAAESPPGATAPDPPPSAPAPAVQ